MRAARHLIASVALAVLGVAAVPVVAHAAFPGANGRITFLSGKFNADGTETDMVRSVRPNGRGVRTLMRHTAESPTEPFGAPHWAPGGRRFALDYFGDVTIARADGSHPRRLSVGGQPNWSPDGRRLVFGAPLSETDSALFVMRTDGSGRRQLGQTFVNGGAESPALSPRGGRLAFEVYRDGAPTLWIARADGSDARPVVPGGARPAFAPDGRTLAYSYGGRVWVMPASGGRGRPVSPAQPEFTVIHGLAFSPDGRYLAYTRQFQGPDSLGPSGLFVIRRDGRGERRLPVGDLVAGPDWQPLPPRRRR
jgi:hypothetical protein